MKLARDSNLDRLGHAMIEAVSAARGDEPPMGQYWEFPRTEWQTFQETLAVKLGPGSGIATMPAPTRDGVLPVLINDTTYGAGIVLGVRDGVEVYDVRTLGTF